VGSIIYLVAWYKVCHLAKPIYHHKDRAYTTLGSRKLMEACLWGFYGGWIFELQWGPLMVIFHHGDAAEDKGEEVRGGAIH